MTVYLDVVVLLNFLVDYFLLVGTNRLFGYPPGWGRCAMAAAVGGLYAGACLVPGFHFLGNILWLFVSLGIMCWIAFGFHINALQRSMVFLLLSMALGGMAVGIGNGGFGSLIAAAVGVSMMCVLGFRERPGSVSYVPVDITYQGKRVRLTALRDTGNTLRDPVTGRSVLIVGADVAQTLTGLTRQQLQTPVSTMTQSRLSGLRLVPYRAVGKENGLLLALRMQDVKIGNWKGSSLVAFAPEGFSKDGNYQALTGGAA